MQNWEIYCHLCGGKLGTMTRTKVFIIKFSKNPRLNNDKTGYVDCSECGLEAPLKFRKFRY